MSSPYRPVFEPVDSVYGKIYLQARLWQCPKKILLRDFNEAVASGGLSFIEKNLADDAIWHLYEPVGQKELRGKENILGEYKNNLVIKPTEFVIESILSHGDEGAVRGTIKTRDKVFVFGDFYKFSSHAKNAKIREMTSYIVEVKGN